VQEPSSWLQATPLTDSSGNDPELDPDREPEPPTKAIEKPVARTGKRNAPADAPTAARFSGAGAGAGAPNRGGQRDNANDAGTLGPSRLYLETLSLQCLAGTVWHTNGFIANLLAAFRDRGVGADKNRSRGSGGKHDLNVLIIYTN
jgi:plasminogen activator inhibitor 1 RNA-binding protein